MTESKLGNGLVILQTAQLLRILANNRRLREENARLKAKVMPLSTRLNKN